MAIPIPIERTTLSDFPDHDFGDGIEQAHLRAV